MHLASPGQLAEHIPGVASLSFLKDKRLDTKCRSSLCPRFFFFLGQCLGSSWAGSGLEQGGGNLTLSEVVAGIRALLPLTLTSHVN